MSQTDIAIQTIMAIADAIRELKEVPSGHLYARVMGQLSLDQFQSVVDLLVRAGLVSESRGHLLTWTGPVLP
jgi:hypothetical protein